jgi:site-specific DNA-adenine methylase
MDSNVFEKAWRNYLESLQIQDEHSIQKMPHPFQSKIREGQPLPTPLRIQGVKNNKMYRQIMQALRSVLGEREMFEPFGGGGGLSQQFQADKSNLNDINPDIGNFMRWLIEKPRMIDTSKFIPELNSRIVLNHPYAGELDIGEWNQERATKYGENKTWLPAFTYSLRDEYNALRQKMSNGTATLEDQNRLAELFYMIQLTGFNSLVRYSKSKELPSWDNPYSVPAGLARDKKHLPVDEDIENSLFSQLRNLGLYDSDKNNYKGGFNPGGNLARLTPFRGGGGIHDFTPWHNAMKNWSWTTGDASNFYERKKDLMNPENSLLTFDPPYFKEEGAHQFFDLSDQQNTIQQMIDAKQRGIPTVVFNSMNPSIVNPLKDAGFDIQTLGRQETSGAKAESRGVVPELMAMANIPQDAFQSAWNQSKSGVFPNLNDIM